MSRVTQISPYNDIHGKNICEGDILRITKEHYRRDSTTIISLVKFGEYADGEEYKNETHCGWFLSNGDTLPDVYNNSEIIGNIYQNPELLTNQNK